MAPPDVKLSKASKCERGVPNGRLAVERATIPNVLIELDFDNY